MSIINRCAKLHGLNVYVAPRRSFQGLKLRIA